MAKKSSSPKLGSVKVTNKSYGGALKGFEIFYEGRRPKSLKRDGSIKFGKNIIEFLRKKFGRVQWIISKSENSITLSYGVHRVRTSQAMLSKMGGALIERTRDIKVDIIRNQFAAVFPGHFDNEGSEVYIPGTFSKLLKGDALKKFSAADREALVKILPEFAASESVGKVSLLQAEIQIKSLKELVDVFEKSLSDGKSESWWQKFIHANILLIQQGYIEAVEKMNVTVGKTKFPDFSLITHDGYLDILEIKTADAELLKEDTSRGNFYWSPEIAKAIIQVENYCHNVSKNGPDIRTFLKDEYGIEMRVVQPRGIILAGNSQEFEGQKEKDDFRLLSLGLKNVTVVTYDELLTRLKNYIVVLERFSEKAK